MSEKLKSGNSAVCELGIDSRAFKSHGVVASHWTKFPPATALLAKLIREQNSYLRCGTLYCLQICVPVL